MPRSRIAPPDRRRHVLAWQRSGLTKHAYALQVGLPSSTLHNWIHRDGPDLKRLAQKPVFAEVEVVANPVLPTTSEPLIVVLAGSGHRLLIPPNFEPALLRELARALC